MAGLWAPGGRLQAGSRGVAALERAGVRKRTWGRRCPGDGPLQTRPHLVHGGQDPAVAPAQGTDLSHLPGGIVGEAELHELALRGSGHGQIPPQPRTPVPEIGTLGVGSVPALLRGSPRASALWAPTGQGGESGAALTSWCSWWQARSVSSTGVPWSGACR